MSVELRNVTKRFGEVAAVYNVNLRVESGEFFVLLGPSGSGKSTLLRIIAGLEEPDEGEVIIGGRVVNDVDPSERDIAFVFQNYALYPHMTVYDNIAFPLRMRKVPKDQIHARVLEVASMLGLTNHLSKYPYQLSGGEQQRVALARAIVRKPRVFLLDEPLSNLDAKLRVKLRFELRKLLHDELKTTTIYVTHDQVEAMTMADRVGVINRGQLVQVGTPDELFEKPSNTFVAGFIGTPPMNFLPARVAEKTLRLGNLAIRSEELEGLAEGEVILGIRPQHLEVGEEGLPVRVVGVERLGTGSILHGVFEGFEVTAYSEKREHAQPELNAEVRLKPVGPLYLFDSRSEELLRVVRSYRVE
ncbi:ABC transporter ATP-binding protein [Thermofilum pendens]|uniref:ABC transporter related n=1 Tax=Thermofilum pendens (strain DSM 2475 / Hrk 5) TaxID=368408 RepID=A1RZB7_THEPD|nr:ABC transporter ATP-binding protein [Thermofilum pendens]ABL78547.1 ABC transporter related [Thermofilum pendens Hrk 5]